MAVPTFVGAGSGASVLTGNLDLSKTCTVGNVIIVQTLDLNSTSSFFANSVTNAANLEGSSNLLTNISAFDVGTTAGQLLLIGRCTSASVTVQMSSVSGTDDLLGRIYEFSGVSLGTNLAEIFDNQENPTNNFTQRNGTSTTVNAPPVTTLAADRLALAFVAVAGNLALDPFTGETGGDWVEAVAEYTSASPAGALGLQSNSMASVGTISGGSDTIGASVQWAADGTTLQPPAAPSVGGKAPIMLMGVG